ncbi:antiterminator LoaP [Butyrivibrio sp. VCD2006]|uniref:antiterminator LoaP n=1 Tax=Butyrivibrio sp. VCD2006 TaxID=1280664 RepID=UPI0003FA72C1|nr:antiterminator LoaP [Butyrivibrio sp. VCD2006]
MIQVKSGNEHKIQNICVKCLRYEDEEVFIPVKVLKKRIKGIDKEVETKLFPGYIFFLTNEVEELFFRLKKVKELTKILKTGDEFVPLSVKEEQFLTRLMNPEYKVDMSTGYIEGDRVVITDGPVMGLEGMIARIDRHKKQAVLKTEFFGKPTEIVVGLEIIDKY